MLFRIPGWTDAPLANSLDGPHEAFKTVWRARYCGHDWTCRICHDDHKEKTPVLTSCGYLYGKACLIEWLRVGRICPLCMKKLPLKPKSKNYYQRLQAKREALSRRWHNIVVTIMLLAAALLVPLLLVLLRNMYADYRAGYREYQIQREFAERMLAIWRKEYQLQTDRQIDAQIKQLIRRGWHYSISDLDRGIRRATEGPPQEYLKQRLARHKHSVIQDAFFWISHYMRQLDCMSKAYPLFGRRFRGHVCY